MSGFDLLQLAALGRSTSCGTSDDKRSLLQLHSHLVATHADRASPPSPLPPKKRVKFSVRGMTEDSRPSPPSPRSVATIVSAASSRGSADYPSLDSEWTERATAEATNEKQYLLQVMCDSVIGDSFILPNRKGTAREASRGRSSEKSGVRGRCGNAKSLTDEDGDDTGPGYFFRPSPALVAPTSGANAHEANVPTSLRSEKIERGAG